MHYHFIFHEEDGYGFYTECVEIDGCRTEGHSFAETVANCEEVLELVLDEPAGDRLAPPLPDYSLDADEALVRIPVPPQMEAQVLARFYGAGDGQERVEKVREGRELILEAV
jgi:predicted RNase H-like HicB family nuclease